MVEVVNVISVNDCGRVINRTLCEGQVKGTSGQGIGYGLFEELSGKTLNPNLWDYEIFTALDMPPIMSFFSESNEPDGPFGTKGVAPNPR